MGEATASRSARWWVAYPMRMVAILGLVGLGVVLPGPAVRSSAAQSDQCPAFSEMPGITAGFPLFTDQGVATYVGGDLSMTGGVAGAEGLTVVAGDTEVQSASGPRTNVGSLGAGSRIVPAPGSTMLAVGGDLFIAASTILDVGSGVLDANNFPIGGAVDVGGAINGPGTVDANGGAITSQAGADAIAPWASTPGTMNSTSQSLDSETVNGATTVTGSQLLLSGDDTSPRQVFTATAVQLAAISTVEFEAIPAEAAVIVNVPDVSPALSIVQFTVNGVRFDSFSSPAFGAAASQILWNFANATTLSLGGSSEFVGSILAPQASMTMTTSQSGRLLLGGDLTMTGTGSARHNYAWVGGAFGCSTAFPEPTGYVSLQVGLANSGPITNPVFQGAITCQESDGELIQLSWQVPAGETITYPHHSDGTECTITLNTADTLDPDGADEERPAQIGPLQWALPSYVVNSVNTQEIDLATDQTIDVEIQNTLLGTFSVRKQVIDPDGALSGPRDFAVGWSCLVAGYVDGVTEPGTNTGQLALPSSGAEVDPASGAEPLWFPLGTACELSESDPALPGDFADDTHSWAAPQLSDDTPEVSAGTTTEALVVTNTVLAAATPTPTPSPSVPPEPTPGEPEPTAPATSDPTADPGGVPGEDPLAFTGISLLPAVGGVLLVLLGWGMLRQRRSHK